MNRTELKKSIKVKIEELLREKKYVSSVDLLMKYTIYQNLIMKNGDLEKLNI